MRKPYWGSSIVKLALQEDVGTGDVTANLIPADIEALAHIISRDNAIFCGKYFAEEVFCQLDPTVSLDWKIDEGDRIEANQILCQLKGKARSLLSAERTVLNFLQTLSATATITSKYVKAAEGTNVKILDTRKTLPGLRLAQKYAVRCGGGVNHRFGLYDAFLIKNNHIRSMGSISEVIKAARYSSPNKIIEVEVSNFKELNEAIEAKADTIMVDNFNLDQIKEAVKITAKRAKLEVSGNVSEAKIKDIVATGVDYISVGALTKNLIAVDLAMKFIVI